MNDKCLERLTSKIASRYTLRASIQALVAELDLAQLRRADGCLAALRSRSEAIARTATMTLGRAREGVSLRINLIRSVDTHPPRWSATLSLTRRTASVIEVCLPDKPCAAGTGIADELPLGIELVVEMVRQRGIEVPRIVGERGLRPNLSIYPERGRALLDALGVPAGLGLLLHDATVDLDLPEVKLGFAWSPRPGEPARMLWLRIHGDVAIESLAEELSTELQAEAMRWLEARRGDLMRELHLDALEDLRPVGRWAAQAYDLEATVKVAGLDRRIRVRLVLRMADGLRLVVDAESLRTALGATLRDAWRTWVDANPAIRELGLETRTVLAEHLQLVEMKLEERGLRVVFGATQYLDAKELRRIELIYRDGRIQPVDADALIASIRAVAKRRAAAWAKAFAPAMSLPAGFQAEVTVFGVAWRAVLAPDRRTVTLTTTDLSPQIVVTARWSDGKLDLSEATMQPANAPAQLLATVLGFGHPTPSWLMLENVELRGGMVHADAIVRVAGIELPLGRFSVGPRGAMARGPELDELVKRVVSAYLQRNPLSLPGLGPLKSPTVSDIRVSSGLSIVIDALVEAPLVGDIPIQLRLPEARISMRGKKEDVLRQLLIGRGLSLVAQALGSDAKIELIEPEPGRFGPLGFRVGELTLDIWVFKVKLSAFEVRTDVGVTVPADLTCRIGIVVPLGPDGIVLAYPGVRLDLRGKRVGAIGDLTVAPDLSKLLRVEATVTTELPPKAIDISGKMIAANTLRVFDVKGGLNLATAVVRLDGQSTPPFNKIVNVTSAFELDGKAKHGQADGHFSVLGLEVLSNRLHFDLPSERFSARANADIVIATMETTFEAGLGLRGASAEAHQDIHLGSFTLQGVSVKFSAVRAQAKFEVLGFEFEINAPSIHYLTRDRVLDIILSVLDVSFEDILSFFKQLLRRKIVINLVDRNGDHDPSRIGEGENVPRQDDGRRGAVAPQAPVVANATPADNGAPPPAQDPSKSTEPRGRPYTGSEPSAPGPAIVAAGGTVMGGGGEPVKWSVRFVNNHAELFVGKSYEAMLPMSVGRSLEELRAKHGDDLILLEHRHPSRSRWQPEVWTEDGIELDKDKICVAGRCIVLTSPCGSNERKGMNASAKIEAFVFAKRERGVPTPDDGKLFSFVEPLSGALRKIAAWRRLCRTQVANLRC